MKSDRTLLVLAFAFLAAGCGREMPPPPAASAAPKRPAHAAAGLGKHHFEITTSSKDAQAAFDRGLTLAYSFAHQAAEEEFRKAAQADPKCAMAHWGIALVNGPHINFPLVPPDNAKRAWEARAKALELAPSAGEREKGLIAAVSARYADPQPGDRSPLDRAYAEAMKKLWQAHPNDADLATLYAEAAMDLRPWDLWTHDGKPQPGAEEILATLEQALKLDPEHPGANHLYIHAVEASPNPERAVVSADRLRTLVPAATHMVHMPSHIYARVGRWDDAGLSNAAAMKADEEYRKAHPKPGLYAMYMAHNDHFYAYAAMSQGRSADAVAAMRKMVASVPEEFLKEYTVIADGYMISVSEALMRFGRWDELLKEPEPRPELPLSRAMWHFTRAVALTAQGKLPEAEKERAAFLEGRKALPKDAAFGNNSAGDILAIAAKMLDGEMAAKKEKWAEAEKLLREAVVVEDSLRYDEPPDWIQPVRHTLGAVLLKAGKPAEAEAVYREDLRLYPENGWSLFGLSRALRAQKKESEADDAEARFKKQWAKADVMLGSTCFCQPGA